MNTMLSRRKMVALGAVCCLPGLSAFALAGAGTYYTTVNIWYEHPQKILTTNYHRGKIIPAGTKVEVSSISRGRIVFRPEGQTIDYTLTFVAKHSTIGLDAEFDRIFSKANDFAEVSKKFDKETCEAIKNGEISIGMNREAVLAAYGYPPSHKTPDLEGDVWIYWNNRFRTRSIEFKDGKVSLIK
ncbi:MAG: hypothetical protein OES84_01445 [Kiritimatiellaceae bacterium]|nr:hypothetical protein [Kiritimatiellaceae bacterium]